MKPRKKLYLLALPLALAACGGGGGNSGNNLLDNAIKADKRAPACAALFAEGAPIKPAFVDYPPCKTDAAEVGKMDGAVVVYAPSTNKCSDGRWLYWNSLAWGYSDGTVHAGALPSGEQRRCAG